MRHQDMNGRRERTEGELERVTGGADPCRILHRVEVTKEEWKCLAERIFYKVC